MHIMGTICKNICSGLNEDQLNFCQHIGDGPCIAAGNLLFGLSINRQISSILSLHSITEV